MTTSFRLPDLGEGIHEAEILAILVSPDQDVTEGEPLIEVETDKAAVVIPSPVSGAVATVHVEPGQTARVGDLLITFAGQEPAAAGEQETPPSVSGSGDPAAAAAVPPDPGSSVRRSPVPASPATRRLARELGVDLHQVPATGANGVVTAQDVQQFAGGQGAPTVLSSAPEPEPTETAAEGGDLPDFSQWGSVERQPFRSIRRATAQRMADSWANIPHVNCQDTVDITLLEDFRQRHKEEIAALGGRLTMTVFALKAVATALKQFPHFNASLDLANQEIIVKKYFHIGIAVDTEHGLLVPVIRDVDRKSIKELAIEVHEAIARAKTRQSSRDELVGGTFTITNAGAIGGSHFSAIINYPEIAILGMGQARLQPVVKEDDRGRSQIVPRLLMPIVLCFDHRVVDGGEAIRFLQVIINGLEDPDALLITMI